MIELNELLLGSLLPAALAAVGFAVVWKSTHHAGAAWCVGLVLGCVAGHWALDANTAGISAAFAKSAKPHEARDWLPLLLVLSIVPEPLVATGKKGRSVAWLLRGLLCLFLPWRLLKDSVYLPANSQLTLSFDTGVWSTGEAVAWIGGIGGALFMASLATQAPGRDTPWRLRWLLCTLVALAGAITLALSGSLTYGQLLGVLTAAFASSGIAAALLRVERGPEAAPSPLVVAFGGALILAHFFAALKLLNAGLLLLSMTTALGWKLSASKLSRPAQISIYCLICLIPLAIAVTLAAIDFSASQAEVESNPYLNFQP